MAETIYDFRLNCYNATLTDPEGVEHDLTNTNRYQWTVDVDEWGAGTWVTIIIEHPDYHTKQIQFELSKWPYWPIPIDLEPDYTESEQTWIQSFLSGIEGLPLIGSALADLIRAPFEYVHGWVNDLGGWINDVSAQVSQDFDQWVGDVNTWIDDVNAQIGQDFDQWVGDVDTWIDDLDAQVGRDFNEWVGDAHDWINDVLGAIDQNFVDWVGDIDSAIGDFTTALGNLGDAIKNADDMAEDTANWLEDKITSMIDGIW